MNKLWISNGKLVTDNGKIIEGNNCPCVSGCEYFASGYGISWEGGYGHIYTFVFVSETGEWTEWLLERYKKRYPADVDLEHLPPLYTTIQEAVIPYLSSYSPTRFYVANGRYVTNPRTASKNSIFYFEGESNTDTVLITMGRVGWYANDFWDNFNISNNYQDGDYPEDMSDYDKAFTSYVFEAGLCINCNIHVEVVGHASHSFYSGYRDGGHIGIAGAYCCTIYAKAGNGVAPSVGGSWPSGGGIGISNAFGCDITALTGNGDSWSPEGYPDNEKPLYGARGGSFNMSGASNTVNIITGKSTDGLDVSAACNGADVTISKPADYYWFTKKPLRKNIGFVSTSNGGNWTYDYEEDGGRGGNFYSYELYNSDIVVSLGSGGINVHFSGHQGADGQRIPIDY